MCIDADKNQYIFSLDFPNHHLFVWRECETLHKIPWLFEVKQNYLRWGKVFESHEYLFSLSSYSVCMLLKLLVHVMLKFICLCGKIDDSKRFKIKLTEERENS